MKLAIIGASAGVGLFTTQFALERGHAVTTLSRRTETLPSHPQLHAVQGSSTRLDDVRHAIDGADSILVTLGTGSSTKPTTLYTDSARCLLQALEANAAQPPLIVLTGFGAGDSWDYNSLLMKIFFNLLLKPVYANKTEMEKLIVADYPRWEIVRPGRLTNGPQTGDYRVLNGLTRGMRVGAISRADVAHFMIMQAEHPTCLGAYPALTR